jgi:hypothetical protein
MIKYTPGPWVVDESNPNLVARLVDGVYEYVCEVAPSSFSTRECSDEQEEADARLIAAAPELLEALKLAVLQNEHDMLMTGEELRICDAAIAKAEEV